jgi:S-methylmethionine-dependent homocysteine/selenocysteine methylase
MSSSSEARCALSTIQQSQSQAWVSWTLHGNRPNILPSGEHINVAFSDLQELEADAYLVNCCGANLLGQAIKTLSGLTEKPIGGYANGENIVTFSEDLNLSDQVESDQKTSRREINELEYASEVEGWMDSGATIIGGCCRTRPSYIKELNHLMARRS